MVAAKTRWTDVMGTSVRRMFEENKQLKADLVRLYELASKHTDHWTLDDYVDFRRIRDNHPFVLREVADEG